VATKFELDIERAKKNSVKRSTNLWLFAIILIIIIGLSYIYLTAFKIDVIQKEYDSLVTISRLEGSAIPLGSNRFYLTSANGKIGISAEGYKTKIVYLQKSQRKKILEVELDYADAPVNISYAQETAEALWYINQSNVASSKKLEVALAPGNYDLRLITRHFEEYSTKIEVKPASGFTTEIRLQPTIVKFDINSVPSAAEVYFGDTLMGISPISGTTESASFSIKIARAGYSDIKENIDLSRVNGSLSRSYRLISAKEMVEISYKPKGGRLFLDDLEVTASNHISIRKTGKTRVRYSHPGYADQTKTLMPGAKNISFNLVAQHGVVNFNANVIAKVFSQGRYLGQTPLKQKFLAAPLTFEMKRDGYAPQKFEMDITKDSKLRVDRHLLTWSEHYLKQSKPIVTNSIGLKLVRFKGKAFQMGAARYVRGQRANEIQRNVTFERAFYLSTKEITESEYALFSKQGKRSLKPVVNISWTEAARFCNWLSSKEGFEPFYTVSRGQVIGINKMSRGYRLPSEAEWEYAARYANKRAPTIFVWGDDYEVQKPAGNIADKSAKGSVKAFIGSYNDGFATIAPSGSFPAEKSGLFDMSGNVSEWVTDALSYEIPNKGTVYTDFTGPTRGSDHIIKGSNFTSSSWTELRASFKESSDAALSEVGFRVARYVN
jgi:formylglycine-generating enzyme required for sulfatase activity